MKGYGPEQRPDQALGPAKFDQWRTLSFIRRADAA
jgi:hypothetical protein